MYVADICLGSASVQVRKRSCAVPEPHRIRTLGTAGQFAMVLPRYVLVAPLAVYQA